jgi:multiple sugar transport system permease protein
MTAGTSVRRLGPLAPAVVLLLVFMAAPVGFAVYYSFTNTALTGVGASGASFVGFSNFTRMFSDPIFRESLILTVIFTWAPASSGRTRWDCCSRC